MKQLASLIGNSMGGMTALAILLLHPDIARSHINISGSAQALPFSIAIRSLQREAIRLDPHWRQGDYDDTHYPESGLRIARKLGVITYRSALEWDGRFGRVRLDSDQTNDTPFGLEFQIENYLESHAHRFVHTFDPNCYLYLSRSMDWFDVAEYANGDLSPGWPGSESNAHSPSVAIPTSSFQYNSNNKLPKGYAVAVHTPPSWALTHRRGMMRSLWISQDLALQ
ncbi:alpha/beta fold hydrolase [Curtobacterium flaccumfaciens pv. poinsettiae]|nr:alpha/beta fold hydrolase [Curtobacterium flaccumfaciens pv. poinsettiae]